MRPFLYCGIILLAAFSACRKSVVPVTPTANPNGWRLAKKVWSSLNSGLITTVPAADSQVVLVLNQDNGTYSSMLNGRVVAQGTCTYTIDTSYYNEQVLTLNHFVTTGIFSVATIDQLGQGGQVISTFSGLYMKTSNDTLTLSWPILFDASAVYYFVKE